MVEREVRARDGARDGRGKPPPGVRGDPSFDGGDELMRFVVCILLLLRV